MYKFQSQINGFVQIYLKLKCISLFYNRFDDKNNL
jgi:hypothetical protein